VVAWLLPRNTTNILFSNLSLHNLGNNISLSGERQRQTEVDFIFPNCSLSS